jgi:DNA-binding response OmpR family regulator
MISKRYPQPNVLIVEDDDLVRDAMSKALVNAGWMVQTAASGHDAINVVRTPIAPIDVVLLDIQLPDISGVDLCARLRELDIRLPVLVCTGGTDSEENAELNRLGIHDIFLKPVSMDELLAAMQKVVN